MATNGEDWGIQLSIKHGPTDDRGNPLYMTNVRGYTAREILDHMKNLAEHGPALTDASNAYAAVQTVQRQFPDTARIQPTSRYDVAQAQPQGQASVLRHRDGELCRPHQLPMRYKSGVAKSSGKPYELLECSAEKQQNPCDTIWPD